MPTVNIADAKRHLSKLVGDVESGIADEIIITRDGSPAAKLVPVGRAGKRLGLLKGRFAEMSLEEFNAADGAVAQLFADHERE